MLCQYIIFMKKGSSHNKAVELINFSDLQETLPAGASPISALVKDVGVVYAIAVTRDKCPACIRRKPYFLGLAAEAKEKHKDRVAFLIVNSSPEKGPEAKDAFGTPYFPTYLMYVKNSNGKIEETYRRISAHLPDIRESLDISLEAAEKYRPKACNTKTGTCS